MFIHLGSGPSVAGAGVWDLLVLAKGRKGTVRQTMANRSLHPRAEGRTLTGHAVIKKVAWVEFCG